ncbi:hypothetical protein DRW42_23730 [Pedobacter miscanthi]|uniref:Uncharacterized protein n=1 Tax=Pedobacter miscanthi TaxID=2259170 RepID=A0A366KMN5_9SPHI|nr:hypothetical protein DRW42_23730 [Pedobacter miscanthi]
MSVSLLKKSISVYKPIFVWNILVSLLASAFFILNGFKAPAIYSFALFLKLTGWLFSIAIYYMFYQKTIYYFKNQGIGFRKIMINLILYDLIVFTAILILSLICRDFLSIALANLLQIEKY